MSDQVKSLVSMGLEHFTKRDDAQAVACWTRALEIEPRNVRAREFVAYLGVTPPPLPASQPPPAVAVGAVAPAVAPEVPPDKPPGTGVVATVTSPPVGPSLVTPAVPGPPAPAAASEVPPDKPPGTGVVATVTSPPVGPSLVTPAVPGPPAAAAASEVPPDKPPPGYVASPPAVAAVPATPVPSAPTPAPGADAPFSHAALAGAAAAAKQVGPVVEARVSHVPVALPSSRQSFPPAAGPRRTVSGAGMPVPGPPVSRPGSGAPGRVSVPPTAVPVRSTVPPRPPVPVPAPAPWPSSTVPPSVGKGNPAVSAAGDDFTPLAAKVHPAAAASEPATPSGSGVAAGPPAGVGGDTATKVATLLAEADAREQRGDLPDALEVLEKIMELDAGHGGAAAFMARHQVALKALFLAPLGNLSRVPKLRLPPEEIIWLNLHHKAGFVLSHVDGQCSFEDIMALSGMSDVETCRILAQLLQAGVVAV